MADDLRAAEERRAIELQQMMNRMDYEKKELQKKLDERESKIGSKFFRNILR